MSTTDTPYRAMIAGVAAMAAIELRGTTYSGAYLSTLLAINPEQPATESARTSQLIAEFGRLVAAAAKEKEMADVRYRIWRDTQIHGVTSNADAAKAAGFGKAASVSAAEVWVRTLPEYEQHHKTIAEATEVWGTLHACYEAALSRSRAVYAFERQGGGDRAHAAAPSPGDGGSGPNVYTGGHDGRDVGAGTGGPQEDIADMEQAVASIPRTALPPITGAPPPPPGSTPAPAASKKAKAPPPPPSK